jgi:hypothetical protein
MIRASLLAVVAVSVSLVSLVSLGCNMGTAPAPEPVKADQPAVTSSPQVKDQPAAQAAKPSGSQLLGAPISPATPSVALASIAKDPKTYENKVVTTSGTVTAVCQHMGCWMEMKDDSGEAHVKLAGHTFFVPKDASGRHARVEAKVLRTDPSDECTQEAAEQTGKPVAKLELEATGVELD